MRTLAEDVLLFVLDDATGAVAKQSSQPLPFVLSGALVAELALRERIQLEGKNLVATDMTPTGDDLLDETLSVIAASKKPRPATHWASALSRSVKHIRERVTERLVQAGIIQREEQRVLVFFERSRYPTADPTPEQTLRAQVQAVLLGDHAPDARTATLVSLLRAANVIDRLVEKPDRKRARARAKAIMEGNVAGKAAHDAAAAAAAAASAASTAATVAVIAASSASS